MVLFWGGGGLWVSMNVALWRVSLLWRHNDTSGHCLTVCARTWAKHPLTRSNAKATWNPIIGPSFKKYGEDRNEITRISLWSVAYLCNMSIFITWCNFVASVSPWNIQKISGTFGPRSHNPISRSSRDAMHTRVRSSSLYCLLWHFKCHHVCFDILHVGTG